MYLSRAAQQPERIKIIQANQSLDKVQEDIVAALNAHALFK
jgi:thymidylate kinase